MNYYELTENVRQANARRYLAQKRYEREQREIKWLFGAIVFIASLFCAMPYIV